MKSVVQSNISWFMLLYIFGILLSCAMEDNKTTTKNYSVKQLQNDFIGLWKNPQKYVEFQLNADKTSQPDAGGLYELLPYYQKINPLGKKTNYAIQWCDFENKWQLIEVNPLGLFASLNNEVSTIATLLEGDHFSKPTKADIKAYTTYEQMKSVVKTLGEQNKELKMKIIKMENEAALVQTENEKLKTSVREKNEKLKKFKVYAQKANEVNELKIEQCKQTFKDYQQNLEEMELLKSNLKEKDIQINNKNESIGALGKQIGSLSYQLSMSEDLEKQFKSLEKDVERQRAQRKQKNENLKTCEDKVHKLEVLLRPRTQKNNDRIVELELKIEFQQEQINTLQNKLHMSEEFIQKQNEDIETNLQMTHFNKMWKNEKKDMGEELNDLRNELVIIKKDHETNKDFKRKSELQQTVIDWYTQEQIELYKKLEKQQQLLDKQESVLYLYLNEYNQKLEYQQELLNKQESVINLFFNNKNDTREKGQNTDDCDNQ